MSSTLLRAGLWLILIVLALYVIHEGYPNSVVAEYISQDTLQKAGLVGIVLLAAGIVLSITGRAASKIPLHRCKVCGKSVPKGEIYCREHLRRILEEEHDRSHGPTSGLR
jgi:hypothetical protein